MPIAIAHHNEDPIGDWVPIKDAARLLGVTAGHLRRQCAGKYEELELARKIDGEWYVSPRLDDRLRPIDPAKRDREDAADLAKFGIPAKHIDRAEAIRDLLKHFGAFDSRGMTAHEARTAFLAHAQATGLLNTLGFKKRPGRSTFYQWEKKYSEAGLVALARKQSENTESPRGTAAIRYIVNLVNSGNRISINQAMTMAFGKATKHPADPMWEIPSYRKVCLEVAKERPVIMQLLSDKGERTARALAVPHAERAFESLSVNDKWNGDECTLDVMYRVLTERGWRARRKLVVTTWQDLSSRMITGAVLSEWADSNTILASLKCGFRDFGLPLVLHCDWGNDYKKAVGTGIGKRFKAKGYRDFDGNRIGSILEKLSVDVRPVLPYHPQSKPIESFYRTFHSIFEKQFPSYWGGSSELRHEDRQKWVNENLEKLPTLEDLCALLPIALDTYHNTPHSARSMFGKTPRQALTSFAPDLVRRESEKVLDHLFKSFVGPKQVRRDGIRHNSRWYRSPSGRTVELLGQQVLLAFQPEEQGHAIVCKVDDNRTPLFEVECPSAFGLTERESRQHNRDKAAAMKPYRKAHRTARRLFESVDPRTRMEQHRTGTAARYGVELNTSKPHVDAPPTLRLHSDLETAISKTERIESDEASEALRTGTDDMSLDDFTDDIPSHRGRQDDDRDVDLDAMFGFDPEGD